MGADWWKNLVQRQLEAQKYTTYIAAFSYKNINKSRLHAPKYTIKAMLDIQ